MKKSFALVLCIALVFSMVALSANALSSDVNDSTWDDTNLEALVVLQGGWIFSDLAPDYEAEFWYGEIPELDGLEMEFCTLNMRGFTVSPDRKYAYMGFLNGTNFRGCAVYDFASGQMTDVYYNYEEENVFEGADRFSYAKGIAADDRGYVYVGFALSQNYNLVNLGIAQIDDDTKKLNEVSKTPIFEYGEPGDSNGIKVGVNGVDVVKIDDRYYCYAMINYTYDALVCYDVTNPANPVLNKDFGVNGKIEFSDLGTDCPVNALGSYLDEGQFMDVDENGVIWLCATFKNGKAGVMKIDPDGTTCLDAFEVVDAYSVCHAGGYIIVGTKNGQGVFVFDESSLEQVGSVKFDAEMYGVNFAMVQVIDDILFVDNTDWNNGGMFNAILVAPLTDDASVLISEMVDALEGKTDGDETAAEDNPGDETGAPADVDTGDAETKAADSETKAEDKETKAADNQETAKPDDKATEVNGDATVADKASDNGNYTGGDLPEDDESGSGCSSVIAISASLLILMTGCALVIRKKD